MSIRSRFIALITVGLAVAVAGCGQRQDNDGDAQMAETAGSDSLAPPTAAEAPDASWLSGTHWQLVEFQSMDDAIGTTRPEDPAVYTLVFNDDGTVAMGLNCNRGTGPWSATPGGDGQSGSITIGPLAVTRALCPPPSMDEQIARDMDFVRGYMLRDGRLSLSLMADGGVYLWEPNTPSDSAAGP